MAKFSSPTPRIPLCKMIGTEAIRRVCHSTERSLTRNFNKMGGYIESKETFTVSIIDLELEETPLTQERIDYLDECWKIVNQRFDESLQIEPEWGLYLSGKMVHILDGNNRRTKHGWIALSKVKTLSNNIKVFLSSQF